MRLGILALICLLAASVAGVEPFHCSDERATSISLDGTWRFRRDDASRDGVGIAQGWSQPGHDDSAWSDIRLGRSW